MIDPDLLRAAQALTELLIMDARASGLPPAGVAAAMGQAYVDYCRAIGLDDESIRRGFALHMSPPHN